MMMMITTNGDNDEKVDFKDLLWRHRAQCAPGWPPLLLVDRATKTAFGGRGGLEGGVRGAVGGEEGAFLTGCQDGVGFG